MRLGGGLLAIASALLLAPAALAQWSSPVNVGPEVDYVDTPSLVFDSHGSALASWDTRAQPNDAAGLPGAFSCAYHNDNDGYHARLATRTPDGSTVLRRTLRDSLAATPALVGRNQVVFLRTLAISGDRNCDRRERLAASLADTSGRIRSTHTLTKATLFSTPAIAANSRGDGLAAWVDWKSANTRSNDFYDHFRLRVAIKRPGGGFGLPHTLMRSVGYSSDHGSEVAVALGNNGEAVVLFAALHRHGRRDVHTLDAFVRRGKHGFGRRLVAGPYDNFASIAPVITSSGRIVVAWGTQDGGEEANRPWVVRAATLGPHSREFGKAQVLDPGQGIERPSETVAIGADAAGRATVAWSGVRGSFRTAWTYPVMVAAADPAGHFGPAVQLAPDGDVGNVAVRPDGAGLVVWARAKGSYQITDQVFAALRGPGESSFGPAETVAPPDVASSPFGAFDTTTGIPTVVWSARPDGRDPSEGVATTAVLRISSRG